VDICNDAYDLAIPKQSIILVVDISSIGDHIQDFNHHFNKFFENASFNESLAEDTDSKEINLWASKKNAGASFSWMKDFIYRYG